MVNSLARTGGNVVCFGDRKVPPRACLVEAGPSVRGYLADLLDDLGFITKECTPFTLDRVLAEVSPELLVIGPLGDPGSVQLVLRQLTRFGGKVMLFGGRHSHALAAAHDYGDRLGLQMLEPLRMPFRETDFRNALSQFLPVAPPPPVAVDVASSLRESRLELWYRPKLGRDMEWIGAAKSLVRVRHPTWGFAPPACFMPAPDDPHLHRLAEFVLGRAVADWAQFAADGRRMRIAVNLPLDALGDSTFVSALFRRIAGIQPLADLLIEVSSPDVLSDIEMAQRAATQLAFHNVPLALDAIGAEGGLLLGRRDLPFSEMKVDARFVRGCAQDRVKQAVCAAVAETAHLNGARAVADGVESERDCLAVRHLGFDLLEGDLFGPAVPARKFRFPAAAGPAARAPQNV